MNYAQQSQDRPQPAGSFLLKSEHWASGAEGKPLVAVRLGLRLLSDGDLTYCQAIAKERSDANPDNYKRELITCAAAVALCDQTDASSPPELFPAPDQQVPAKLRPETIQAIYDELERLMIETSPISPVATDDELYDLAELISEGGVSILESASPDRASRFRRLARFLLDELNP